jgi:hypothetical protein
MLTKHDDATDSDSDFQDSYYDAKDGDDDLFAHNVDRHINDHNALEKDFQLENDEGLDDTNLR